MLQTIIRKLNAYKIPYRLEEHEPVFTVAEAESVHRSFPVKNLLLKEEKGDSYIFIIMDGYRRLDTKFLAQFCGKKKLRFASTQDLADVLGVTPGSVSLFSLTDRDLSRVCVLIERKLQTKKELAFHPNDNAKSIFINGQSMISYLEKSNITFTLVKLP